MAGTCVRCVGAASGYLVASSVQEEFQESWFRPQFWGAKAVPVAEGGRGAAWFIDSGHRNGLVLRHFCRGGLPGRFIRRDYLFSLADSVRSFVEFRLLDQLFNEGLPVPEPLAAGFRRRGWLLYQAEIIVRRIPSATPLGNYVRKDDRANWVAAGVCVRRFHERGVCHADLNCMNILVADHVYLIDFDRGRLMPEGGREDWKNQNISRLARSVNKAFAGVGKAVKDDLWSAFLEGYEAAPDSVANQ